MVDDWLAHTPKDILAKNFGVNESIFENLPKTDPYILASDVSTEKAPDPNGELVGNSSYVYHTKKGDAKEVPGGGGTFQVVDSRNFPIATTIASAIVVLEPKGLRELHWHPNVRLLPYLKTFLTSISLRRKNGCTSYPGMRGQRCSLAAPILEHLISPPATQLSFPIIPVRHLQSLFSFPPDQALPPAQSLISR